MRLAYLSVLSAALIGCGGGHSEVQCGESTTGPCVPDAADAGMGAPDADRSVHDWTTHYGGPDDEGGSAIATAPNGDLVMIGGFAGTTRLGGPALSTAGLGDVWVARYRADGTYVWSTRIGAANNDFGSGVAVDSAGDVYVVGHFTGPIDFGGGSRTNANGGFLVKLSGTNGAYVWDRVFGASDVDAALGVTMLDTNTVAIGGRFTGTVDFGGGNVTSTPATGMDSFVAAYDINGAHVWSKALVTTGDADYFGGIASVGGDLLVTAGFSGTATLGGSPLVSSPDGVDVFVARYRGGNGGHVWSIREGGPHTYPQPIVSDGTYFYVGGAFSGTTNLGGADLGTTSSTGFIAAYGVSDGSYAWAYKYGDDGDGSVTSLALFGPRLTAEVSGIGAVAISSLAAATGASNGVVGSWLGDPVALTYTGGRLAGVGTFRNEIDLFHTHLVSDGRNDIVAFGVTF